MFSSMLSLLGSLRGGSSFVTKSLRFRSSASAYLSRTATLGNRTTWTWSAWVKRGALGTDQVLFNGGSIVNGVSGNDTRINFSESLSVIHYNGTNDTFNISTTARLRDPSAWYHFVVSVNTNESISSDRIKIYINGALQLVSGTYPGPGFQTAINNAVAHRIGSRVPDAFGGTSWSYFDGYLTEVNFIDGQALTPASFGAISSSTGVWAPRSYSGTYGTNGFYLKFADASAATAAAIGKDSSGNAIPNNWTPSGISVTAGATYDSMLDVPVNYNDGGNGRGNYATLNPLGTTSTAAQNTGIKSFGNLRFSETGALANGSTVDSTISVSSGKFYFETTITALTIQGIFIGVFNRNMSSSLLASGACISRTGSYTKLGATITTGLSAYTVNDVVGFTIDADANTIAYRVNNGSFTTLDTSVGFNLGYCPGFMLGQGSQVDVNFGQRPFIYTPPAGFLALNTQNLPTPSIVNGANFMAATTYTGNAAARSLLNTVNNVSFQPDLVWIKSRTPDATNHALFDSVRGVTNYLSSNLTAAETTLPQSLTAFNADGFSLGTDITLVNANANSYIAWQWKESALAGLDVVSYTGTGVDRTVAHNLGVAPAMVIVKRSQTGGTGNWQVRHTSIAAANSIQLNSIGPAAAATTVWASTVPSSSVFTVGTSTDVNASGIGYVAYCFAEISGFSRFGSYAGNNSADGPFVFCGFRPRWVMIKATVSGYNWRIIDTSRNTFNLSDLELYPNSAQVDNNAAGKIDITSNGFKIRTGAGSGINDLEQYIFAAFAETPSKYALAR